MREETLLGRGGNEDWGIHVGMLHFDLFWKFGTPFCSTVICAWWVHVLFMATSMLHPADRDEGIFRRQWEKKRSPLFKR